MGRADGRGEVLAAGTDGAAESGGEGHLHRLRGWAERISGSHRSSVSAHRGAALHRACGTGFAELRALETAQTVGRRSAIDLSRGDGGRGRAWPPRTGKQVESLSQREPGVAAELGTDHAVFQLPAGHPPGDLHYQQRGVAEPLVAQDHQNSRRISQRRGGAEVAVSRFAAGSEEMDHAHSSLARSAEPLHNSVAGTDASPGESRIMKTQNASKSLGRGRGTTPFPCTPSPKTKPGRLHKRIDTPGGGSHASVMVNHHRHNSLHDVILSADSVLPRKTESSEGSMHSRRYYYLYIMTNRSKTLYTGITSNLSKRVFQHKNGTFPGFMSRYRIDRLV